MKLNDLIINEIRHLYKHFYGSILLLTLLTFAVLFRFLPFFKEITPIHVTWERYDIVLILILIPLTLKWFANRIKQRASCFSWSDAKKRYRHAYFIRHYLLSVMTLLQIVFFGMSRNTNFFWLAVVLFVIFFFCKPSLSELENLMKEQDIENDMSEDNHLDKQNNDSTSRE